MSFSGSFSYLLCMDFISYTVRLVFFFFLIFLLFYLETPKVTYSVLFTLSVLWTIGAELSSRLLLLYFFSTHISIKSFIFILYSSIQVFFHISFLFSLYRLYFVYYSSLYYSHNVIEPSYLSFFNYVLLGIAYFVLSSYLVYYLRKQYSVP